MIKFPIIGKVEEPEVRKMTSDEYIRFCEFCVRNNPHITPETCMDRKSGEEDMQVPFRL